jgi:hypothetical protein
MTTSGNDFEIANAVASQLKGLEKGRQQRILRWVAESLGLELGIPATGVERRAETNAGTEITTGVRRHMDIKSFVDSKKPKSDVQFVAVVAYYYRFEAPPESQKDQIDAGVLQEAARLVGRRRPPSPRQTLNNAKLLGYLDSSDRGKFHINTVGENLVAMTLPGKGSESATKIRRSSMRRTKRSKR